MTISNIIEKNTIDKHIEDYKWKGDGTNENPIIIDSDDVLPQSLLFQTDDLHIQIKNIDLGELVFEECQNIILEDSIISIVKLKSCKNVIIRDNSIITMKILFGEDLSIINNRIYGFSHIRRFTILMFISALISGSLIFLSYIEFFYFLREPAFLFLVLCAGLFLLDIIEKKNKIFVSKKYRNNEFINLEKETSSSKK